MAVITKATVEQVLAVARGELGVHENPPNSNRQKYGEWAVAQGHRGMNGVAWCNIFVSWVLAHAGVSEVPFFSYTPSSQDWFTKQGAFLTKNKRPKPGDLIWFDFPNDGVNRTSHIGIVEGILADGRIATIEGNTNGQGGRTGGMVMRHNRSISGGIVGYGSITYSVAAPTPPEEEEDMKNFVLPVTIPAGKKVTMTIPPYMRADYGFSSAWFTCATDLGKPLNLRMAEFGSDEAAEVLNVVQLTTKESRGSTGIQLNKWTRCLSFHNQGDVDIIGNIEMIK